MTHRLFVRASATLAAAALATLATGPAFAATPVAQGSATALEIALAGNNTGTGTYAASNDGTTETTSGTKNQLVSALSGTTLIPNTAVAAQDVNTRMIGKDGVTDSCAGLAGPGAGLVEVGNSGTCLSGGNVIDLDAGTLDLTGLKLSNTGVLAQLTTPLQNLLQPVLTPVLTALSQTLTTVVKGLGNPGLHIGLGAVQASCHSTPTSASGTANIANAQAYLTLPAPIGKVTLLNLPANPGVNTDVVTQLGNVVQTILDALKTELQTALGGALGPAATLVDQLGILKPYLNQLGEQLAPLNQILSIGLNQQTHTASNQVSVTALNLKVLDAASSFIGSPLVGLKIGQVSCGPNSRLTTTTTTKTTTPTTVTTAVTTPSDVKSGIGSLEDGPSALALAALAGLTLAGASAGVVGFRRSLRR
ncbi:hypothetical protein [Nocardioides sp.]|uniref:hypothetical protein n=1 Tax=Nocardioides sp. TaxID=35761 RepID=UPI00260A58C2|nr:hypothetical protein [Nocardioides sp.]